MFNPICKFYVRFIHIMVRLTLSVPSDAPDTFIIILLFKNMYKEKIEKTNFVNTALCSDID